MPPTTPAPGRGPLVLRVAALVALVLAVHGHTVGFGFSFLDDDRLILDEQAFLSQPSSLWRSFGRPYFQAEGRDHAFYRPLVNASFVLDALRTGRDPRGYHLTNVGLHALAASLLFILLRRLCRNENVAWAGSLLFAVHPALTEAVAWIPGRNDTLMTALGLGSWLLLLRSWEAGRWMSAHRIGHLLTWLAALFAKETAIVLPVAFLSHLVLVERRRWRSLFTFRVDTSTRPTRWLLPGWLATLGVYLAAREAVATEGRGLAAISPAGALSSLSLFASSLGKLVLPVHLSVLAIPEDTWRWPGVAAIILLALLALLVPRARIARADMLFGLVCFVAFVAPGLPASNLLVLENRLYLPAVGLAAGACAAAASRRDGFRQQPRPTRAAGSAIVVAAAVLLLGLSSHAYGEAFRDRLAFCQAAVRGSPHSALAHRNLGVTYQVSGNDELAQREYEEALHDDPSEPVVHNNLAVLFMARGRLLEAEQQLREELAINPRYASAHANLARVLEGVGRADDAAIEWQGVLALDADSVEAMRALSSYYGPRDATKAARFETMLRARGDTRPPP